MPIYVYYCIDCELEVEELRPISMADAPMWCPVCGEPVKRGLTAAMLIGSSRSRKSDSPSDVAEPAHAVGCPCCVMPRRRKRRKVRATGK